MLTILRKTPGIKFYYRLKLALWAFFHLPRKLKIANTKYEFSAHNWQVAIPCRTDSTLLQYEGRFRNIARMIYEPNELPQFEQMIKDKKCFFDVGANIGYYSHIAAANGVKNIIAFEFMPEYSNFLSKSFKSNRITATLVNRGVGDPTTSLLYGDPLASHTTNKLVSLDQFAKEHNLYPDIMKIDIEGAELDALKHAHEILSKKPDLDISIHPVFLREKGQTEQEVLSLLEKYGYKVLWTASDTYFMSAK